jgi:hypothetical protein
MDLTRPSSLFLMLSTGFLLLISTAGLVLSGKKGILLWASMGVLGLIAVYSILRANLLFERYYIGCAPVLLVGVGCALDFLRVKRPQAAKALLAAACLSQTLLFFMLPPFEGAVGYRGAVEEILARERGPVAILTARGDGPPVRYCCRRESGRVVLRNWAGSGTDLNLDDPPLYYLHSNAWGDRRGEVRAALSNLNADLLEVYDGRRVSVYRVRGRR